jgi:methylthioribose-1-phosphate isomerase
MGDVQRTIWWDGDVVSVIDQRVLPHRFEVIHWRTVDDAAEGIESMQVRGAPLIGVSAACGIALAALADPSDQGLRSAGAQLVATRPTAVNLAWGVNVMLDHLLPLPTDDRPSAARELALQVAEDDVASCRQIAENGVGLIESLAAANPGRPVQIMTHCNAGWLACVEWGTATAAMYLAFQRGIDIHVWVSETRPRNQGASLTAWELGRAGVPHSLIVDNSAGHLMQHGMVDIVIVGADRVAADGSAANKIGTYLKAVAATDCGVPFHVAAPASTFDLACPTGRDIPIEERSADEVLVFAGNRVTPETTPARNWGFDVTPPRLITSFITDRGIVEPTIGGIAQVIGADAK